MTQHTEPRPAETPSHLQECNEQWSVCVCVCLCDCVCVCACAYVHTMGMSCLQDDSCHWFIMTTAGRPQAPVDTHLQPRTHTGRRARPCTHLHQPSSLVM